MAGPTQAVSLPANLLAQAAAPPASVAGRIRDCIEQGWALLSAETEGHDAFNTFRVNRSKWDDHVHEVLRRLFKTDAARLCFSRTGVLPPGAVSSRLDMARMRDSVTEKVALLQSMLDQFATAESPAAGAAGAAPGAARAPEIGAGSKVVVAHAGAAVLARLVAGVIEGMRMNAVLVSGVPGDGEDGVAALDAQRDARFGLVVVGADLTDVAPALRVPAIDLVAAGRIRTVADPVLPPQPGALLMVGYLAGRLGRSRVCALHEARLRTPGAELGVDAIPFDAAGAWTVALMKRLGGPGSGGAKR